MGPGVLEQHQDLGIQKKRTDLTRWFEMVFKRLIIKFYVVCPNLLIFGPYLMAFSGVMIFTLELEFLFKSNSAYCDPIYFLSFLN